jgi:hypothetical protein
MKYAQENESFIRGLTAGNVQLAKAGYRGWNRSKRRETPFTATLYCLLTVGLPIDATHAISAEASGAREYRDSSWFSQ